jgi:hypothetical protein
MIGNLSRSQVLGLASTCHIDIVLAHMNLQQCGCCKHNLLIYDYIRVCSGLIITQEAMDGLNTRCTCTQFYIDLIPESRGPRSETSMVATGATGGKRTTGTSQLEEE